jgi:UDP-N-acetylglucosamine acyltransferase
VSEVLSNVIHKTAIIHPSAEIGDNVNIGPWTIIGANVVIGDNTSIASSVIIDKNTKIGCNNKIYPFASIGIDPQDKKHSDKDNCSLEIGDNNIFREYVTISRGTPHGGGITKIGSNNMFMAYVHIAHDCIVGNSVVFANNATLAGHVTVGNFSTISGFGGLHQFCHMGDYSFLGMRATVSQDIAPYVLVAGAEPSVRGINVVGLKRRGFSDETIKILRDAYKAIFRSGAILKKICMDLDVAHGQVPEVRILLDFIKKSERGLLR